MEMNRCYPAKTSPARLILNQPTRNQEIFGQIPLQTAKPNRVCGWQIARYQLHTIRKLKQAFNATNISLTRSNMKLRFFTIFVLCERSVMFCRFSPISESFDLLLTHGLRQSLLGFRTTTHKFHSFNLIICTRLYQRYTRTLKKPSHQIKSQHKLLVCNKKANKRGKNHQF